MKDPHLIVIKPLITEKSTWAIDGRNAYSFRVASDCNRIEVKSAVEEIFDVKVKKVNTSYVRGKRKRLGQTIGFTRGFKKAVVTLYPGYKIEVY